MPNNAFAPIIVGCAEDRLTADERALFRAHRPIGLIIFRRNVKNRAQLAALTSEFREVTGRPEAFVLIDQEGGRVARLVPPEWRKPPPAAIFAALYQRDRGAGLAATRLNARLIAHDLTEVGIDTDCAPVLDLLVPAAHDIVGDRAYGEDPADVAALAQAVCDGFRDGGIFPVIKHIPGHGRAHADSHIELPVVREPAEVLAADLAPFRALKDQPMAMTAHIVYAAFDATQPASTSAVVIGDVIRREIGFDGLLMSDDLNMAALTGTLAERAVACLTAGCDLALHCSGKFDEMAAILAAAPVTAAATARRVTAALAWRRPASLFDPVQGLADLERMLAPVAAATRAG